MTFVTEQYLKINIRELRSEIKAVATELGGDIKSLNSKIEEQQDLMESLSEQITRLTHIIEGE